MKVRLFYMILFFMFFCLLRLIGWSSFISGILCLSLYQIINPVDDIHKQWNCDGGDDACSKKMLGVFIAGEREDQRNNIKPCYDYQSDDRKYLF